MEKVMIDELIGQLNETEKKFAPPYIYIEGDCNLMFDGPRVSIVGSRKASQEGIDNAVFLAKSLVKEGIVLVSGLAEGIDTAVHKTAINENGKTIAVLGTPLDVYYPAENRKLQEEIMKNHLIISQFPLKSPIQRGNFPMRNRTMALISQATIIVEAGDNSGSLHQGWEALRLGRPLFILEPIMTNKKLEWPQEMIKYGAVVLPLKNFELLFEILTPANTLLSLDAAF